MSVWFFPGTAVLAHLSPSLLIGDRIVGPFFPCSAHSHLFRRPTFCKPRIMIGLSTAVHENMSWPFLCVKLRYPAGVAHIVCCTAVLIFAEAITFATCFLPLYYLPKLRSR